MFGNTFRPWGELKWMLSKQNEITWDILGTISTEERCLSIFDNIPDSSIGKIFMFRITDPPSRATEKCAEMTEARQSLFLQRFGSKSVIENHELLEAHSAIVKSVENFVDKSNGNIILDISSFPKRFFFPILKILQRKSLKNLMVVYSTPESYSNEELSEDPDPWAHLPLFGPVVSPEPQIEVAIVGVGFMPFGLSKLLLGRYSAVSIKMLFPFPPGPPNYQRTWDFVRSMERVDSPGNIIRINSHNVSDAFEYLLKETANGTKATILAPYGPKPISLAMCLFAIKYNATAYYTQPRYYNPEYSKGVKSTFAYSIILESKNLY